MSHRNNILLSKWHLIENHPLLREKYREPPLISMYRRGKSLTDILVRAKLLKRSKTYYITKQGELCLVCQPLLTPFSTSGVPRADQKFGPNCSSVLDGNRTAEQFW